MGVPANIFSREYVLDQFKRTALVVRSDSVAFKNDCAARSVNTNEILGYLAKLRAARALIISLPSSQAFKDYAQASFESGGYTGDIVADGSAMKTQIEAVINWVVVRSAQLWRDNTYTLETGEGITTFSITETATFRTVVQGLIDTIDG